MQPGQRSWLAKHAGLVTRLSVSAGSSPATSGFYLGRTPGKGVLLRPLHSTQVYKKASALLGSTLVRGGG